MEITWGRKMIVDPYDNWIVQLLDDIRECSLENDLPQLASALAHTIQIAQCEIRRLERRAADGKGIN